MRPVEQRTLNVLHCIDTIPAISQRGLARRLKIALGTANGIIQTLLDSKWIKTSRDRGKTRYSLTAAGVLEKKRLLHRRLEETLESYAELREHVASVLDTLPKDAKRIVFYGVCDLTEIAYIASCNRQFKLVAVASDTKPGTRFMDHEVLDGTKLRRGTLDGTPFDAVLIVCPDRGKQMMENLTTRGFKPKEVFALFV